MKRSYPTQAKIALAVYLRRGDAAIALLQKDDFDNAMEMLRLRDAAYHNFRALDHLALDQGIDIGKDGEVRDLWLKVEKLNKNLMYMLLSQLNISAQQLKQTTAFRRDLQKYASGTTDNRFLKIV